jgi:hypothetical protein
LRVVVPVQPLSDRPREGWRGGEAHGMKPEPVGFCKACRRPFKRTGKQNRYWHAEPFLKMADHFGCSVVAAKLALMGEFWGWEREPISGHEVPVKAHTSDMTVKEGSVFLDWLVPFAAERGVEILLPDEWKDA